MSSAVPMRIESGKQRGMRRERPRAVGVGLRIHGIGVSQGEHRGGVLQGRVDQVGTVGTDGVQHKEYDVGQ